MSALSVATRGYFGTADDVATRGYLSDIKVNIELPRSRPNTDEGSRRKTTKIVPRNWREIEIDRDDSEVVELLVTMLMADIL